ncbi:hypothetical protein N1851_005294 [Merluccius polli]|uniref:C2H2-type domain-containing protein n=1 Tax=Merluccius polli TaxID=89951 RepID=A0AA47N6B3_MERPO|nr:hypothetical protein N1851_005294 [Merluccius polli]
MNCRPLPWALRLDRLAEVEQRAIAGDPSLLMGLPQNLPSRSRPRHGGVAAKGAPPRKKARGELSSKVDQLAADMEHMKSLLLALQPGTGRGQAGLQPDPPLEDGPPLDDALSLAASASFFNEASTGDDASHTLGEASCSSAQGSLQGAADTSMTGIMRGALARLGLDAPQTDPGQTSAFFRRNPAPATFTVPPSEGYVKELHACWRDSRALSHSTTDAQTLAAMQDAAQVGLSRMPPVEPAIASLILAPDEALRPDARCPRPQCRAYDSAARMGRIGNSLSHLLLGLSTSLQQAQVEPSLQTLSDASLQAFALMARELGRTMSTLVQTRRQVWLAQSPLTETCRKVLRAVPVEPGELFGAAALEALERAARARQTRQELSGLHRSMSAPSRPRGPVATPQRRSKPDYPGGLRRSQRPVQQPAEGFRAPERPPPWQPHGKKVSCPYTNCSKYFRVRSSFASHLNRKHKKISNVSTPCSSQTNTSATNITSTCMNLSSEHELGHTFETIFDDDNDNTNDEVDTDGFMNNLAMFYLRMQAKMLLPASTIQTLIEEMQEVHTSGLTHILSRMHEELTKLNVPESDIKRLLDDLSKENLLKMCNEGVFRTDQTRKTCFKSRFNYVEPVKTYLGIDAKGKERFYQYVPIKETIKSLLTKG